jgi:voltage-gated potassium channel
VIRTIGLLRVFRIFKLGRYLGEAKILTEALKASRAKIIVFLLAVLSIVVIAGTLMYLIGGRKMALPVYLSASTGLL